ncbi:MAG: hypothetical protein NVS9B3_06920 [Gemmatimonadaceae bacterium]
MASRFHKSRQRRAEREPLTAHGNINLIPLVDILTSIVFFSLLTYTGAVMAQLTAFDLKLPPVMVTGENARTNAGDQKELDLMLAVRITPTGVQIEHHQGPFKQAFAGLDSSSLNQVQAVLAQIKQQYPTNDKVSVVPDDNVAYDDIVHVLERVKEAKLNEISLGSAVRSQQVALSAGRE